jgi:hypothetical protein
VVEETPLLPRKPLPAPERHLCPRQYKKGYKTPLPILTHGITGFRVLLHSPICSLSLLFSTNKIFPTSAVRVCLCFHSQCRLKNPEHLKFLHVSSVHHLCPSRIKSTQWRTKKISYWVLVWIEIWANTDSRSLENVLPGFTKR